MQYTEGDVNVKGVTIHYYRTGGDKPPFVLLHGASDNGLCWTPVAEQLAADYDVVMLDAQGHGRSGRVDADYSFARMVDQAVGVMRELGIEKPVVMGHSMGAGTTVGVAVNYPDVPKAIILEDPAWMPPRPPGAEPSPEEKKVQEGFQRLLESYTTMTYEQILASGRETSSTWSEAELEPWARAKMQFDPEVFKRPRMLGPGYEELVPKLRVPTLLITSDGGIVPEEVARKAKMLATHPFTYIRIKGAGHNIRREQPAAFMKAVREFLHNLT